MFRALFILGLALLASCFTQEQGVLVLSEADFSLAVKQHDYLFVKFYTPWCGHCKKLAPIWIELAAELSTTLPQVRLAEVDLDVNKNLQGQLKIQSFPTLLFFKNGVPINFGGARNKEFMTSWLGKKIQEPIIAIDEKRLASLETDGNVNVVFYGKAGTPQYNTLLNIAKVDDYNMYYRVESSSKPDGSAQIFRPFGVPVTLQKVDYNVRAWINLNDRPLVYTYDDRTTKELYTQKRNGIVLFVSPNEQGQTILTAFKEAAVEVKIVQKKKLIFTHIDATDESYAGLSSYIKINPELYPIIFIKPAEKLKYIYTGKAKEVTAAKIVEFIKNVEANKIRKWKMDEDPKAKAAQQQQKQQQQQPTATEL